jgi:hypothetical protein
MKLRITLTCLLAATALWAANTPKTYTGQISDSQCAMNIHSKTHSHAEMLQGGHMGKDPSECAKMCVHDMGGAYVLLTKSTIYKLDDQKAADAFVGKSVQIEATLDPKDNTTLHVISIKAAQ